jgi:hypothetical protein
MTSKIEYKGQWKLPYDEEWINGTLSFDPEYGGKLELFGTFNPNFLDQSSKEIILGKTDNGDITLIDNWYRTKKVTAHTGVTIGIYEPIKIIKGHHFKKETEINFRKVIFKPFNLFQWLAKTGQNHDFRNHSSSYSLNYEEVPRIEFELNENCTGYISFDAPLSLNADYNAVNFREEAYVNLIYSDKVNLSKIIEDVTIFVQLITLLTFEQSYPIDITLKDQDYTTEQGKFKEEKFVKCFYRTTFYSQKHNLRNQGQHIVRYSEIEPDFPKIIQNWFNLYHKMEPVIILMLHHFKSKYLFSSDKFMDSIRALESYHRQNFNNERIPIEKFDKLVADIKSQVDLSEDDEKWLSSRLIGNEPSLATRLEDLVTANQNEYIIEKIKDLNKYCHKATSSRNYYTHYTKELENRALKGSKLSELTRTNRGLLFSCILKEIGIENEYFEKGLKYNL